MLSERRLRYGIDRPVFISDLTCQAAVKVCHDVWGLSADQLAAVHAGLLCQCPCICIVPVYMSVQHHIHCSGWHSVGTGLGCKENKALSVHQTVTNPCFQAYNLNKLLRV